MLLKNQSNPIKIFYRTIVTLFSSPPQKMFKSHFILKIVCFFICICQAKIITFQKYIYFSKAIQIIEISFKKQESWTNSETKDSASLFNVNCHFFGMWKTFIPNSVHVCVKNGRQHKIRICTSIHSWNTCFVCSKIHDYHIRMKNTNV